MILRRTFCALLLAGSVLFAGPHALVKGVDSIGLTVSDLDRSVEFYSSVLHFQKVSETEVDGETYEHLAGVFGLHMRTARMRLGEEFIELTEFLAPRGRPAPADARSNDRWFQHIAIIVSDMDRATNGCAITKCNMRLQGRSFSPHGTRMPAESAHFISAIRTVTLWRPFGFLPIRATRSGTSPQTNCFWE